LHRIGFAIENAKGVRQKIFAVRLNFAGLPSSGRQDFRAATSAIEFPRKVYLYNMMQPDIARHTAACKDA